MARLSIQLDELIVWPPYFIQIDFDWWSLDYGTLTVKSKKNGKYQCYRKLDKTCWYPEDYDQFVCAKP